MFNPKLFVKNSNLFAKIRFITETDNFGKTWQDKTTDWFLENWNGNPLLNKNFLEWFSSKKDNVESILELGCGVGIYPIKHEELFRNKKYLGTDISKPAIDYAEAHSNKEFICGDFLKMNIEDKFDMIFAHGVIDCVYDVELFLQKINKTCKKYAYISSCRGYHPNLLKHKMHWRDEEGCYYNDLSVSQLEKFLLDNGLSKEEFIIRPQESGASGITKIHAVIEINKKKNN